MGINIHISCTEKKDNQKAGFIESIKRNKIDIHMLYFSLNGLYLLSMGR